MWDKGRALARACCGTPCSIVLDDFGELNTLDERKHALQALLGDGIRELTYEYDSGDSWRFRIAVKPLARLDPDWCYPLCTAGTRAAPPYDVGGPPGCKKFLAAIRNPAP